MAILFTDDHYLLTEALWGQDEPDVSVSIWFSPAAVDTNIFLGLAQFNSNSNYVELVVRSNGVLAWVRSKTGQGQDFCETTGIVSTDVWQHATGVQAANNDIRVYLNGEKAISGVDLISSQGVLQYSALGRLPRGTLTTASNGSWSHLTVRIGYSLTDADEAALREGAHPYTINSGLAHLYMLRGNGPVSVRTRDSVGGVHFDDRDGSPAKVEERPVIRNYFMAGCG